MKKLVFATTFAFVFGAFAIGALGVASADVSETVQKTFRGKILVTDGALPGAGMTDELTIKKYNQLNLSKLVHTSETDDVYTWSFDYTAFLTKAPKITGLSFDFYTADKEKLFVANKGLMGIDPTLTIMRGRLSITEDDGVNRKRAYVIKLTGKVGKKDVTFAETTLTLE